MDQSAGSVFPQNRLETALGDGDLLNPLDRLGHALVCRRVERRQTQIGVRQKKGTNPSDSPMAIRRFTSRSRASLKASKHGLGSTFIPDHPRS